MSPVLHHYADYLFISIEIVNPFHHSILTQLNPTFIYGITGVSRGKYYFYYFAKKT